MRNLLLPVLLLAALVAAVAAIAATKTVKLGDNFFSPKTLTVKKGTTVKFTWKTKAPHNVQTTGKAPAKFNSGSPRTSQTYSRKLTKAGTYNLLCIVHPEMTMKLRVR